MKALFGFIAALALSGAVAVDEPPAPFRPYSDLVAEAQAAFASEDFALAASRLDEAQAQRPYSLFLTRNRVLARFLSGDTAGALALASSVAARGLALDLPPTEAFNRLRSDPAFAEVLARFEENRKPVGTARIAAEYPDTGLLPEAIVKIGDDFLIGSVRTGGVFEATESELRKITQLDGGVFDLASSTDGASVVAVANNQLAYEKRGERPAAAAFVTFDLASGSVRTRTEVEGDAALLGDVEAFGAVMYATDSLTPRVLSLAGASKPETLAADPRFVNLQGLALDRKKRRLYVADYLTGLFVIDLKTKSVAPLANPSDAHLGGIDGLYLHQGDLIGVQNGTTPQRIVRIDLDGKGTTARKLTVLQQSLPEWNEPTHGIVDGDMFVYIATSNWPAYGDDGAIRDGAALQPLRLMSVDLK